VKKFLISALSVLLLAFSGCQSQPAQLSSKPKVIVSMAPYKTFIDIIGDGKIDVVCLVPKGTNPHIYETPPQLIEDALKAKLWFCLGEPGEKKFAEVLIKRTPGMRVIDLSKGLPLCGESCCHHHDHSALDKHIWLSPRLAKIQAEKICDALCDLMPEDAPLFRHRLHSFQQKLQALDQELTAFFSTNEQHKVLITHPSLAYFCRDYGLEQISIEIEGKEPLPKDVEHIFEAVRSHHIDRVLIQLQHPTKGALRIAEELKLSVKTIDPYEEDYFTNLRSIANAIGK